MEKFTPSSLEKGINGYRANNENKNNTYTKIISPTLAYAGMALEMAEYPYEYRIASSVFMNFAISISRSKCTSASKKGDRVECILDFSIS